MLYHLLYPLSEYLSVLNVFRYITFRTAYAMVTALVVAFALGPPLIRQLRRHCIQDGIREDVPRTHQVKKGTPSMGGLLILAAVIVPTLLWADLGNRNILLVLTATVWLGVAGFIDDYLKIVRKRPKGLVGRYKLAGQIGLGLAIGIVLQFFPDNPDIATRIGVPFLKNAYVNLGWFYIPFVILVITATSNAVNLADGLDGLAAGMLVVAIVTFAGICYVSGNVKFADYLNIYYVPGSGELAVFCGAAAGALLGFLWFNSHPAQVFMGDTGSLAMGGALGTLAILIKKEYLLLIIGGVFVLEVLSVVIQVISFKCRGRRVFRMAPLHHHFELLNWAEPKVVIRFWIGSVLLALLGLSTLKLR
ncbi:MAG: phospho-N-acetylmuramoyl-pentapeptide-transferase [Candidatus Eisenbacteria sp.]|nr:phospho-N-acetylmuramoyl-pentapeptide-transferase [Candidatus Eisenbacteria bacterium]